MKITVDCFWSYLISSTGIVRWFHSRLSVSHGNISVQSSCINHSVVAGGDYTTTLVAMGNLYLSLLDQQAIDSHSAELLDGVFSLVPDVDAVLANLASVLDGTNHDTIQVLKYAYIIWPC